MIGMTKEDSSFIYCHGLPGSSEELNFLSRNHIERVRVFGPQHQGEIEDFINSNLNQKLHVIGFSLGTMAAINISVKYEHVINMTSLISPAAPLELGNFLPGMAGRFVFQLASRSALQFRVLTALQKAGACFSSELAISTMFKGSPESETALLHDPNFKKALVAELKESYGKNNTAYRREIHEYVQPWAHNLAKIKCPVMIYHGAADNWAPIEMAYALQDEITSNVEVVEYRGLGHFSTLRSCLLYTSPSPRDRTRSRMPSSA